MQKDLLIVYLTILWSNLKPVTPRHLKFLEATRYTDQYKQSFFVSTLIDWNHLDDTAISSSTIDSFKKN